MSESLEKTIDRLILKRFDDRFGRKTIDKAVYYGGHYDRNGQLLGGLTGGPRYGFAQRAVTGFDEKIGFVIPQLVACRFRQGTGFALHADVAPGIGARASFDIQLAPTGTAPEGTWTSIFTTPEAPETLYHIQDENHTFSGIDIPTLKTAFDFYDPLDIEVPNHIRNETVHIMADWAMRCMLVKYDEDDGDTDYGALADLVFMVILDTIE